MKFTNILKAAAIKLHSPASDPDSAIIVWHSAILDGAQITILRDGCDGCCKNLIPTWDDGRQQLYDNFIGSTSANNSYVLAEQKMKTLNEKNRKR